jgi:hypothetical protein
LQVVRPSDNSPRFFEISLPVHFWRTRLGISSTEFWKSLSGNSRIIPQQAGLNVQPESAKRAGQVIETV